MGRKKGKHRLWRGHWCWCCGKVKANEEFSGRGHARHLCRQCARLGRGEIEFRQAVRNIDRCFTQEGQPRRRMRRALDRFLDHECPEVRKYAEERLRAAGEEWLLSLAWASYDDALLEARAALVELGYVSLPDAGAAAPDGDGFF